MVYCNWFPPVVHYFIVSDSDTFLFRTFCFAINLFSGCPFIFLLLFPLLCSFLFCFLFAHNLISTTFGCIFPLIPHTAQTFSASPVFSAAFLICVNSAFFLHLQTLLLFLALPLFLSVSLLYSFHILDAH